MLTNSLCPKKGDFYPQNISSAGPSSWRHEGPVLPPCCKQPTSRWFPLRLKGTEQLRVSENNELLTKDTLWIKWMRCSEELRITCNSCWKGHKALHRCNPFVGDHRHRIRVILPYQGDHQSSLIHKVHVFANNIFLILSTLFEEMQSWHLCCKMHTYLQNIKDNADNPFHLGLLCRSWFHCKDMKRNQR